MWGTTFLEKKEEEHGHTAGDRLSVLLEALRSGDEKDVVEAVHELDQLKDPHAGAELIALVDRTRSDIVLQHAAGALASLGVKEAAPALRRAAAREDLDSDLRVSLARAILDLQDPGGFPVLIDVFEKADANQPRREAKKMIEERTGLKFEDAGAMREWWALRGPSLRWKGQTSRFE